MHVGPAVLALLVDERPADAVPHLALTDGLAALAGTYESYRGITTFTVERTGGGLVVRQEADRGGTELALVPDDVGGDVWTFQTVEAGGARVPVRFERTDGGWDMFYQRWRLHQTD